MPQVAEVSSERINSLTGETRPYLRGWFHAIAAPLALTSSIILVVIAPTLGGKITSGIYGLCSILLFSVSGIYHIFNWPKTVKSVLKRIDHANILLLIAGTNTPLSWMLLPDPTRTIMLTIIWVGAILGLIVRVIWLSAPRWLYTPFYIVLGLAPVSVIGQYFTASVALGTLICIAGGLYIVGAMFYGFKWPSKNARWFGYHELFHAFTIAAFTCFSIAIYIAVLTNPLHQPSV